MGKTNEQGALPGHENKVDGSNWSDAKLTPEMILENIDLMKPYVQAMIAHTRLVVLDKDFRIHWVNDEFCKICQYEEHDLIGRHVSNFDFGLSDLVIISKVAAGERWSGEIRCIARDGTPFWVKSTILPISNHYQQIESYLVLVSNITATKLAQEEKSQVLTDLRKSEARYRVLVESQPDFIMLGTSDGTLTFHNTAFCEFFGRGKDECVGLHINQLSHLGIPASFLHDILELCPKKAVRTGLFPLRNARQEERWIRLSAKGIFDADAKLFEFLLIGQDVTEIKSAEIRRDNYANDLERIAFMSSHKVRGPIASLLGLIELLRMNAIHSDQWSLVLESFSKCVAELDVCARELSNFIYARQTIKSP